MQQQEAAMNMVILRFQNPKSTELTIRETPQIMMRTT
jgi:hypothetical protein